MYRFKTHSGSIYVIDTVNKTWKCEERAQDNDPLGLRTMEGSYIDCKLPVVGERFNMVCPPINPGTNGRFISTSPVVEIM